MTLSSPNFGKGCWRPTLASGDTHGRGWTRMEPGKSCRKEPRALSRGRIQVDVMTSDLAGWRRVGRGGPGLGGSSAILQSPVPRALPAARKGPSAPPRRRLSVVRAVCQRNCHGAGRRVGRSRCPLPRAKSLKRREKWEEKRGEKEASRSVCERGHPCCKRRTPPRPSCTEAGPWTLAAAAAAVAERAPGCGQHRPSRAPRLARTRL